MRRFNCDNSYWNSCMFFRYLFPLAYINVFPRLSPLAYIMFSRAFHHLDTLCFPALVTTSIHYVFPRLSPLAYIMSSRACHHLHTLCLFRASQKSTDWYNSGHFIREFTLVWVFFESQQLSVINSGRTKKKTLIYSLCNIWARTFKVDGSTSGLVRISESACPIVRIVRETKRDRASEHSWTIIPGWPGIKRQKVMIKIFR